jgi:polyphosphate kinase
MDQKSPDIAPESAAVLDFEGAAQSRLRQRPDRFINRELSWLHFNRRVLEEASNANHPVLERLRFLSISAANLDEFFMVRVAGLKGQQRLGIAMVSDDGQSLSEQLARIGDAVAILASDQQAVWGVLRRELAKAGIVLCEASDLTAEERSWLEDHFLDAIFPVLTPLAIDPAHPFPVHPESRADRGAAAVAEGDRTADDGAPAHAGTLDRFIRLPSTDAGADRFIRLDQAVTLFVTRLFPGYAVEGQGAFRLIRDSDIEVEEEAEDLVRFFESALKRRRRGSVIRLEIEAAMPEACASFVAGARRFRRRESS